MTLVDALLAADTPLIAEIKPRSADRTDLLRGRSPVELAREYERAGAPCLSVVTGRWFGGSLALLREVATHTNLPVLHKDFLTSAKHLDRARNLGASAVLLTAAVLPATALPNLIEAALSRNLTPFVEVTTPVEIARIPAAESCVVAVNNKDITTRERGAADLARSGALLPSVLASGTRCPVSASGVTTPDDARTLLNQGYAGVLVGTALLRSGSIGRWLDELRAGSRRPGPRWPTRITDPANPNAPAARHPARRPNPAGNHHE